MSEAQPHVGSEGLMWKRWLHVRFYQASTKAASRLVPISRGAALDWLVGACAVWT
jgi:hypothetical protein